VVADHAHEVADVVGADGVVVALDGKDDVAAGEGVAIFDEDVVVVGARGAVGGPHRMRLRARPPKPAGWVDAHR
jgi:hypothetical protein